MSLNVEAAGTHGLEVSSDELVYSLELTGHKGMYTATVQAGFAKEELPSFDKRYYTPEDEATVLLNGVHKAFVQCRPHMIASHEPEFQEGVSEVPILGRVISEATGATAMRGEVDKFRGLPTRPSAGLTKRCAIFLGKESAYRFLTSVERGSGGIQSSAIRHAFSAARPHVGDIAARWQ